MQALRKQTGRKARKSKRNIVGIVISPRGAGGGGIIAAPPFTTLYCLVKYNVEWIDIYK